MSEASSPLMTAVAARLKAATSYTIYGLPVPQDSAFPYITSTSNLALHYDDKGTEAEEILFVVESWSQGLGEQETHEMLSAAKAALHNFGLTVVGYDGTFLRWESQDVILDPDGKTTHGIARYRTKLKSTA